MKNSKSILIGIVILLLVIVGGIGYIILNFEYEEKMEKRDLATLDAIQKIVNIPLIMEKVEKNGGEFDKEFKTRVSEDAENIIKYIVSRKESHYLENSMVCAYALIISDYFGLEEEDFFAKKLESYYDNKTGTYYWDMHSEEGNELEDRVIDTCMMLDMCENVETFVGREKKIEKLMRNYVKYQNTDAEGTMIALFLKNRIVDEQYYERIEKFEKDNYEKKIERYLNGKNYIFSDMDCTLEQSAELFHWDSRIFDYNKNIFESLKTEADFGIDVKSDSMCSNLRYTLGEVTFDLNTNAYFMENISGWLQENYEEVLSEYVSLIGK